MYIYIYIYILAKTRQYPLTVIQQGSEAKGNRSGKIDQEILSRISNKKFDQEFRSLGPGSTKADFG